MHNCILQIKTFNHIWCLLNLFFTFIFLHRIPTHKQNCFSHSKNNRSELQSLKREPLWSREMWKRWLGDTWPTGKNSVYTKSSERTRENLSYQSLCRSRVSEITLEKNWLGRRPNSGNFRNDVNCYQSLKLRQGILF